MLYDQVPDTKHILLHSFSECQQNPKSQADNFRHIEEESAYYSFTPGHTLQATYCRRIFNFLVFSSISK